MNDLYICTLINPFKSGLGHVQILSYHNGVSDPNRQHPGVPFVTLRNGPVYSADVAMLHISIESTPRVLSRIGFSYIDSSLDNLFIHTFDDAINYVARNYEIFLKHLNDTSFEFDDEDMFEALRSKGEYK